SSPVGRSSSRPGSPARWRPSSWSPRASSPRALACRRLSWPRALLEPHAVCVAVIAVAHVRVAVAVGDADLAHDDHAGGAPIDAERTPSAHVIVDQEHDMVTGIAARELGVV